MRILTPQKTLIAAFLLQAGIAQAASTGGIDTPAGIAALPVAVQGTQGLSLVQPTPGTTPYLSVLGNMSVGTAAMPQRRLDVFNGLTSAGNGSARVYGYQAGYEVFNAAGTADWYFADNDADGNSLYIGRGYGPAQGLAPNIVITQNGLVGIGTTIPGARVTTQFDDNSFGTALALVNTSTGTNAQSKIQLTSGNYTSYIYQQGSGLFFWTSTGNGINFYVNNGATSAMTMQPNGMVGVDNPNPNYPLDVKRVGSSGGVISAGDTVTNRTVIVTTDDGSGNVGINATGSNGQNWMFGVQPNGTYFIGPNGSWGLQINLLGLLTVKLGILQLSDERLKKDIAPISNAVTKLQQLKGVTFHWRDPKLEPGEQMGVIAQDVEKVFPDAVSVSDQGFKTVNYSALVAPLIQAVKELQAQNDALNERLTLVERQITAPATR